MALIIKRIELKDFISHKSTRIELGEGIIALVGENGAGKSSIVDAVYMGLSVADRSPRGSTLSELIRHGTASARISIELSGDTNAR
ncbi:MAG: AAA family ATPase, partial [Desulfurococcales archaeon]|nr:AAA family ATPase [Desulfurococcales archaeon]